LCDVSAVFFPFKADEIVCVISRLFRVCITKAGVVEAVDVKPVIVSKGILGVGVEYSDVDAAGVRNAAKSDKSVKTMGLVHLVDLLGYYQCLVLLRHQNLHHIDLVDGNKATSRPFIGIALSLPSMISRS
jgi:hypothetical protein